MLIDLNHLEDTVVHTTFSIKTLDWLKSSWTHISGRTKYRELQICFCTASINRQLSLSPVVLKPVLLWPTYSYRLYRLFCFKSAIPVTERQWGCNTLCHCIKANIGRQPTHTDFSASNLLSQRVTTLTKLSPWIKATIGIYSVFIQTQILFEFYKCDTYISFWYFVGLQLG